MMNITIETPLNPATGLPQRGARIIEVTKDRGAQGIFSTKILIGVQNRQVHGDWRAMISIPTHSRYMYEASIILGVDLLLSRFRILKNRFGYDGYYDNLYRTVTRVSGYIGESFRLSNYEEHQLILMINRVISEITDMAIFFTRDGYFMSERDWYIKGYQTLVPRRNLKKLDFY